MKRLVAFEWWMDPAKAGMKSMRHKKVLVIGVAAAAGLCAAGLFVGFGPLSSTSVAQSGPETTRDIGARWGSDTTSPTTVSSATFTPHLTADDAIRIAIAEVKKRQFVDLTGYKGPVLTTIGLFTGRPEDSKAPFRDLPIRIVVFYNYPQGGAEDSRLTMAIDDATGSFVRGAITFTKSLFSPEGQPGG